MNGKLLERLKEIKHLIGNTPTHQMTNINISGFNFFAKLESFNMLDNIKVRPAYFILEQAIKRGQIDKNTVVIESSSGNFAISLASLCNMVGIKFIPVIDPNINPIYENLLYSLCETVIKVSDRDDTGGFLKTRLDAVRKLMDENKNSFWTNQYQNNNNYMAHYQGLGNEIGQENIHYDYVFIAVSTLGTISGISNRIKELSKDTKVVAVDVKGSAIFSNETKSRYIPGIGSSINPKFLKQSKIDDYIIIDEFEGIVGCWELMKKEGIFVGGSSGCVFSAAKKYIGKVGTNFQGNILLLFADGGFPYIDTIYNPKWINLKYKENIKCYI